MVMILTGYGDMETAIEALGSLGDPSTVPLLVELGGAGSAQATASLRALRGASPPPSARNGTAHAFDFLSKDRLLQRVTSGPIPSPGKTAMLWDFTQRSACRAFR